MMLHLIAFRNVKVHWRQSLAALLSISAAFFAFVIFQGYMLDVERMYLDGYRNRSMFGDMIIENKLATSTEAQKDPWKYNLQESDQSLIQKLINEREKDILAHARLLNFHGLVATGSASKIFLGQAYDVEMGSLMRDQWKWDATYGEPLHASKEESPVILGEGLARQLGCVPVNPVNALRVEGGYAPEIRPFECKRSDLQISVTTESGNLNAMDFQVSGLLDAGYKDLDVRFLMIPLPQAQQLLNTTQISIWTIKLKDGVDAKAWRDGFNQELQKLNPQLHAIDWVDHQVGEVYQQTMSLLNIFRNFVTIIVAFISVMSVMNTMVKIVKERTREIGTLLSLGFQRSQVLGIFLLEAIFLSLFGSAMGAVISILATFALNNAGIMYKAGLLSQPIHFQVLLSPLLYLAALVLLITVTVLTSFLVCKSTVQKKIVECLGHV